MKSLLCLFLFYVPLFFTTLTLAQTPPAERIVTADTPLQQAIDAQLQTYAEGGRPEVLRTSNALIYPYGVYQPVLTCTVLRICIIELESGETLYSMGAGDNVRWNIDHGTTGPRGQTVYITLTPTDYDLTTNLVISTDRRMYHITLDSPPQKQGLDSLNPLDSYTRHIQFYYPSKLRVVNTPAKEEPRPQIATDLQELNYSYSWTTENSFPWEPLSVFDDGERVYLRIPDNIPAGGILLLGQEGNTRAGTFIMRDGFLIIERIFEEARIILPGPPVRKRFWKRRKPAQSSLIITKG